MNAKRSPLHVKRCRSTLLLLSNRAASESGKTFYRLLLRCQRHARRWSGKIAPRGKAVAARESDSDLQWKPRFSLCKLQCTAFAIFLSAWYLRRELVTNTETRVETGVNVRLQIVFTVPEQPTDSNIFLFLLPDNADFDAKRVDATVKQDFKGSTLTILILSLIHI